MHVEAFPSPLIMVHPSKHQGRGTGWAGWRRLSLETPRGKYVKGFFWRHDRVSCKLLGPLYVVCKPCGVSELCASRAPLISFHDTNGTGRETIDGTSTMYEEIIYSQFPNKIQACRER